MLEYQQIYSYFKYVNNPKNLNNIVLIVFIILIKDIKVNIIVCILLNLYQSIVQRVSVSFILMFNDVLCFSSRWSLFSVHSTISCYDYFWSSQNVCHEFTKHFIPWGFSFWVIVTVMWGPGSVVGIATAYGLDGPGIESRWGEIFRTCPDRPWCPPSLLYNGYRVLHGGKVLPGREVDPSPPSSAEV